MGDLQVNLKGQKAVKLKQPSDGAMKWITLNEGDLRIYVLVHPDPAYHQRYLIERIYPDGRKTPLYKIRDKLKRCRGVYDTKREATVAVYEHLKDEQAFSDEHDLDIRVIVHNLWARGKSEEALMAIIDYFDKSIDNFEKVKVESLKRRLDAFRGAFNNIEHY